MIGQILSSIGSAFAGVQQAQYQADLASNQAWYQYNVSVQQADYQNRLYQQQDELFRKEQEYSKVVSAWNIDAIQNVAAIESNLITNQAVLSSTNASRVQKAADINLKAGLRSQQEALGTTRQVYAASGFAVGTGSAKATEKMVESKSNQQIKNLYNQQSAEAQNYRSQADQLFQAADQRVQAGAAQATTTLLTDQYRIRT